MNGTFLKSGLVDEEELSSRSEKYTSMRITAVNEVDREDRN